MGCALSNQYERCLLTRNIQSSRGGLVDCVFEGLAGFEGRNVTSSDLDGGTGLRVTTGASGTLTHGEGTKTDQGDLITLFQGIGNGFDEGIQRTTCRSLGDISAIGNLVNQLRFIHSYFPLLSNIATALISRPQQVEVL